jgi:hypothetical protein
LVLQNGEVRDQRCVGLTDSIGTNEASSDLWVADAPR